MFHSFTNENKKVFRELRKVDVFYAPETEENHFLWQEGNVLFAIIGGQTHARTFPVGFRTDTWFGCFPKYNTMFTYKWMNVGGRGE